MCPPNPLFHFSWCCFLSYQYFLCPKICPSQYIWQTTSFTLMLGVMWMGGLVSCFCYAAVIWPCNVVKGPCSRYTLLLVYLTSLYPPWVLWGGSSGKNLILPLPFLKELAIYPSCWCTYTHVLNGLVGNHYLEVAGGNCCIKILCSLFAMQDRSRIVRTSPTSWLEMP